MATLISAEEASKCKGVLEDVEEDAVIKAVNILIKRSAYEGKKSVLIFDPIKYQRKIAECGPEYLSIDVSFSRLGWLWEKLEQLGYTLEHNHNKYIGGNHVEVTWG